MPMYVSTSEIVQKANSIVAQCGTRDPIRIARDLGIEVMYYPFNEQRGAYKVLMRNRFIFVKNDLHPVMENIVLLHELGHDALHREEATKVGGFKEFEIFNMRDNRMEYEANLFAAQISLPDDDFLELAERGYDTQQIARTLHSDINLVALKADTLISQGYQLCKQEHRNDFLKYNVLKCVDHSYKEVFLLGIGKELNIALSAMMADHSEASYAVALSIVVQHIGKAPVHLVSLTGICGITATPVALRCSLLPLGRKKILMGGDVVLYNGQLTIEARLLQTLQDDCGVADTLL